MNAIISKIEKLRYQQSMINFKDFLSADDYDRIKELDEEINELYSQLKGVKLVALKVTNNKYCFDYYLTNDPNLCCSSEPTWFDSKEEAMEYYEKADLERGICSVQFEEKEF